MADNGKSAVKPIARRKDFDDVEIPATQEVLAAKPFPVRALGSPLGDFVTSASEAIGCPPDFVALPALSSLAAAIGNSVCAFLQPGTPKPWVEPSVLWTAIVGEPGSFKSPAQRAALGPAEDFEHDLAQENTEAKRKAEAEELRYQIELSTWKSARKESKRTEDPPRKPEPAPERRFIIHDITLEALGERLEDNPRGLLQKSDELATILQGFDRYRAGGRSGNGTFYLSMHDAGSLLVDRKGGDRSRLCVAKAALSITGGIQPGILRLCLGSDYIENGLAARILFSMPPRRRPPKFGTVRTDEASTAAYAAVFRLLLSIPLDIDDRGRPRPRNLHLAREAAEVFGEFCEEVNDRLMQLEGHLAGVVSKAKGTAARLALVLELVKTAAAAEDGKPWSLPAAISADSVRSAVELTRWFFREAERVYGMLREDEAGELRRKVFDWIVGRGGHATAHDVSKGMWAFRGRPEAAEGLLGDLVKRGQGRWETEKSPRGGPAKRVFWVIHE